MLYSKRKPQSCERVLPLTYILCPSQLLLLGNNDGFLTWDFLGPFQLQHSKVYWVTVFNRTQMLGEKKKPNRIKFQRQETAWATSHSSHYMTSKKLGPRMAECRLAGMALPWGGSSASSITHHRPWLRRDTRNLCDRDYSHQAEHKRKLTWNITTRNLFFFMISSCLVSTLVTWTCCFSTLAFTSLMWALTFRVFSKSLLTM